jgi:hypothetical protein
VSRLEPFDLPADRGPLPARAAALLEDGAACIDRYLGGKPPGSCAFVPCDHELVYRALRGLRRLEPDLRCFCEWGSGLGVVAALAAQLGFDVHGIEIDSELAAASRQFLAAHGQRAAIWTGSFVPDDYARSERLSDLETRTVLSRPDVYGDMELAIDDFGVVYAYPWPTEEEQYLELFARYADPGAVLLTFSGLEGVRAYRQVAARRRRR